MDSNLDKIALDLYGKIQTRFPSIKIGDENAAVLSKKEDIPKARFFEFEYEEEGESLGTIAITLDADDGIVVQVSGDLVDDNDTTTRHAAYKFIRSFRSFAKDRLLNFDVQNIGKSNLDKRDYQFQAKRKELPMEPMMENKMYGNNRMSYQDLGEARLVVKHSAPVNLELPAGRTMHIESIYIENAVGERFKYPFKHLNGARALAEHIKHGGNPYDPIGKHICGLSEELASLRKFKGYVNRQEQLSEAMSNVTTRVMERIEEIKKTIQHLQRPAFYESFAESFEAQDEVMIPEEVQNDLIDRLTIRTFNEELKSVFPYIAKFVNESELDVVELGADEILSELSKDTLSNYSDKADMDIVKKHRVRSPQADAGDDEAVSKTDKHIDKRMKGIDRAVSRLNKESLDPVSQFENFMDSILSEDDNAQDSTDRVAQLNDIMSQELKGGPEGVNAIETLTGLINDPAFLDELKNIDGDLDVRPLIQQYLQLNEPEIAKQIVVGDDEAGGEDKPEVSAEPEPAPVEPQPAPAEPTAEVPAAPVEPQPAPVAEGGDEPPFDGPYKKPGDNKDEFGNTVKNTARHLAHRGLRGAIEKAKKAGAKLDTKLDFGHKAMTLHDAMKECGMEPAEFGFEEPSEQGTEGMLNFISGFYDKGTGSFPLGAERVKIKLKKAWEDGAFGDVDVGDVKQVFAFIDQKDPGSHPGHSHSDISRLAGISKGASHSVPKFDEQMDSLSAELNGPIAESDELNVIKQLIGKI